MGNHRQLLAPISPVNECWLRWGALVLVFLLAVPVFCVEPSLSTIHKDESIVFYPTAAWRDEAGTGWVVPIHGCVYEVEARQLTVTTILKALEWKGASLTKEQRETLRERLRFMTVDNQRGRTVVISLGTGKFTLGKSAPDGHFRQDIRLSDTELERLIGTTNSRLRTLSFSAVLGLGDTRVFGGSVVFTPPAGVTVISDIDDTIKHTQVRDLKAMLRASFIETFTPVPGMAHLYQEWERRNEIQVWYVSASPWQLYAPLSSFLSKEGFPAGPISLRKVRLKDQSVAELFKPPAGYKRKAISEILSRFPDRRFVLVGDSGEKDPEVYGDLARHYPAQVAGVLIRDITGESEDSVRYSVAFREVPRQAWRVFSRPEQALDFPLLPVR